MRNLLFFDLDGTLIQDATYQIPVSALEAMTKAKQKGNLLFINTGRPYSSIPQVLKEHPIFDGILCGLGTNIYFEGKEIFHHALSQTEAKRIMDAACEHDVEVIFEGKETMYMKQQYEKQMFEDIRVEFEEAGMSIITYPCENPSFDKMCVCSSKWEAFEAFSQELHGFTLVDRGEEFYEIAPTGVSKATAIDYMCEKLGVDLEHCYVFGDSFNDLPMLEHVKHSIVMGNGNPALFELCEFVTKSINQDGIAYAIAHYGLD